MRNWLRPAPRRVVEATPQQLAMTGAYGGSGYDPVDNVVGWRRAGAGRREVPVWTRERAVASSVAGYRSNPMATAIIDTYVAFAVGDKGVSYTCSNPEVQEVVQEFWDDPRNRVGQIQPLMLRSQMLWGELAIELMTGAQSGVVRFSPMDPALVDDVVLDKGNALWPAKLKLGSDGADERELTIAQVSDESGLREGNALWWTPWKTLVTDLRGMPFLMPILDQLDSYDTVLSNLIDRTALARYLVWDVTVTGSQPEVDAYIAGRGGLHIPPSGSVEVHNESVVWEPKSAPSGAQEDTQAASAVLTQIAGGSGLSKTWLAEPDGANRATSLTMAEPVRRRVGGLQGVWLDQQTEKVRYVVDRAVAAGRLPKLVQATDPRTGAVSEVAASMSVIVTGPEIAAADAQITAGVLVNLATGLNTMVQGGLLTPQAGAQAARKAWEDFMGVPYKAELDGPDVNPDDLATYIDEQDSSGNATVIPLAGARESAGRRDGEELHKFWTRGEGLARWVDEPQPWYALRDELAEHITDPELLAETTTRWYHDVFSRYPNSGHSKQGKGSR